MCADGSVAHTAIINSLAYSNTNRSLLALLSDSSGLIPLGVFAVDASTGANRSVIAGSQLNLTRIKSILLIPIRIDGLSLTCNPAIIKF